MQNSKEEPSKTSSKNDSYLPVCWNDDSRMNALFAPFRNKSVNPQDWESKLTFWRNLISVWCSSKHRLTFHIYDLNEAFMRNGSIPGCLNVVLNEMIRSKELITEANFKHETNSNTWSAWVFSTLVKKPAYWSFQKLKSTLVSVDNTGDTLVHINAVKSQSEAFLRKVPNNLRNIMISLDELHEKQLIDQCPSDFEILLNYLVNNSKIDVKKVHNTVLIKIYESDKVKKPISDIDLGIYSLQQQEQAIIKNLEKLEIEKENAVAEAKAYLVKGHRQMAKTSLRKKHELEKRIDKRAAALDNVQILLAKIKDAETDSAILDAYKLGLSSLKTTFKEAGLSEDSVADTMLELGEVLEIHDDIEKALSQPCVDMFDVDLEEELADLVKDDTKGGSDLPKPPSKKNTDEELKKIEEAMKTIDIKLPDVPSTNTSLESEIDVISSP